MLRQMNLWWFIEATFAKSPTALTKVDIVACQYWTSKMLYCFLTTLLTKCLHFLCFWNLKFITPVLHNVNDCPPAPQGTNWSHDHRTTTVYDKRLTVTPQIANSTFISFATHTTITVSEKITHYLKTGGSKFQRSPQLTILFGRINLL